MSDQNKIILKQVVNVKNNKEGYRIDKGGIFRIHIVNKPIKKKKKVNQFAVTENMLYRAKTQISESKVARSPTQAPY